MRADLDGFLFGFFFGLSKSNEGLDMTGLCIAHRHDIDFGDVVGRALRGEDLGARPKQAEQQISMARFIVSSLSGAGVLKRAVWPKS